jgi:lipoyl(octanoyl) transferase
LNHGSSWESDLSAPVLDCLWLGRRPYAPMYALQLELFELRKRGAIGDVLLCLEHEPVITLGRGARPEHLLAGAGLLAERGIALEKTDRGGEITLHAPGQLVGYPIVNLAPDRCDVRRYVRDLSGTLRDLLEPYAIRAGEIAGLVGVWVDGADPSVWPGVEQARAPQKIAAIGVRLSRWVSMHGFALNLSLDLDLFRLIVPCGITQYGVCSLASLGAAAPSARELAPLAQQRVSARLGRELGPFTDVSELPLAELPRWLEGATSGAPAPLLSSASAEG